MPRAVRTAAPRSILAAAALALLGACGHQSAIDSGLNRDLVLADQLQQRNALPLVAARDSAPATTPPATDPAHPAGVAAAQTQVFTRTVVVASRASTGRAIVAVAPATVHTSTSPGPTARPAAANGGTYDPGHVADGEIIAEGSSGAGAQNGAGPDASYGVGTSGRSTRVDRAPQTHGERDAILGSVAGAIIGAATGHGLRGGVIGAVAGGALGAIYGGAVDRSFPGYPTYAGVQTAHGYRHDLSYRASPGYRVPVYRTF